ncbi:hypothetical protein [Lysinibacter cavernae]|uniref:Uncharacterized protein n=1 Tax=Lysinibacter cavernae TaxID=1640652 RepID=A0A7X5R1J8_9MICO|nr:hypothetical protein [Lysinibacter cavernae]NIH53747.1 hypothetical protein [Lysinibacter cavernae]
MENAIREQARQVRDAQRSTGTERNLVTQELSETSQRLVETVIRLEQSIAVTDGIQQELLARSLRKYDFPNISLTVPPSQWVSASQTVSVPALDKRRPCQIMILGVPEAVGDSVGALSAFATLKIADRVVVRQGVQFSPASTPANWVGTMFSGIGSATLNASPTVATLTIEAYNFVGNPHSMTMSGISISILPS